MRYQEYAPPADLRPFVPQRILYRKTDGGLFARVENIAQTKGEDFPFRRTSCE